jgi:hypothetical protein
MRPRIYTDDHGSEKWNTLIMSDVIISIEHLSSLYRLGPDLFGATTLRESESVNNRVNPWLIHLPYHRLVMCPAKGEATDLH